MVSSRYDETKTISQKEAARKAKEEAPTVKSVRSWLASLGHDVVTPSDAQQLPDSTPKRWVIYEPMVLLPSGSFSSGSWPVLLDSLSAPDRESLWRGILDELSARTRRPLSHLAVNEGIPLHVPDGPSDRGSASPLRPPEDDLQAPENILRAPSGLRIMHGDFGPTTPPAKDRDFESAFWVSTRQNGIFQTWAPRWTMFSRGNIKEKARLLDFHGKPARLDMVTAAETDLPHRVRSAASLRDAWAVDLYAGIGYFAFSYARLGLRVLCWELNPWSVEGLRRGAEGNGWGVRVVRDDDLALPTAELLAETLGGGEVRIVVFLENNVEAARRVRELREADLLPRGVIHANCGFLPSSVPVWRSALEIVSTEEGGGWLHLHENVARNDIGRRGCEIQTMFDLWTSTPVPSETTDDQEGGGRSANSGTRRARAVVEHTELVKSFAPEVWHCVFDVYVSRRHDIES